MTVVELKQRLKQEGLPVSGKKSELISRLEELEEEFIVIDEEETVNITIKRPTKIPEEKTDGKIETYCRSCRATLRYPSDYSGTLTCPKCKRKFKVEANPIGSILSRSSFVVFILTIMIGLIFSLIVNDGSPEGKLASGIGAGTICISGLTLSVILFVSALMYSMAKKPLNLE
tara:strand:- start:1084 stop:1602 length:519 start_codon:yes stop_codon:yes gene_type:complete